MTTTHPAPDLIAAVARAESEARALHDAGRCHVSEWSCSFCEARLQGVAL